MGLVKNTHGLKATLPTLSKNTSLHNPDTPTHVNRSCDFNCDFSGKKKHAGPTPWATRISARGSPVAIAQLG